MPSNTFLRLPKEKKERILKVSIDEFAEHTFTEVSINQIIKKAGIPRGSFYQYFENKEDLYKYIWTEINKEKFKLINEILNKNKSNTFVNECAKILEVSIIMGIKHPKYNQISKNMDLDQSDFIKDLREHDESGKSLLIRLIKKEQELDKIKKDVNPDTLATIVLAVLKTITKREYTETNYTSATKEFKEVLKIIEGGIKNV